MQLIDLVYIGFFGVMIFSSVLWLLVYVLNRSEVHGTVRPTRFPEITFLVPAYNEEKYVSDTLDALLSLDYPDKLNIIAVNDGSTDSTMEQIEPYAERDNVMVLDQENQGKAAALNNALAHVDTELVAAMDADSYPEPAFLQRMIGYLERPEVKGVTPALKVLNPRTWVQKVIWTEYVFQIFLRKMFAIFDAQYVLPGPGSVYKTDYLKDIGGWDEDTLTEDMEVAFRMLSHGARIENSTTAYVYTVSPATLKGLFRQRIRWYRGYIENLVAYWDMFGNREYGNLGVFLLPFNAVWLLLIMFFLTHFVYRIGDALVQYVQTYLLVGFLWPSFSFNVMDVTLFHLFATFFILMGVGTILISLRTAGEAVRPWQQKVHYGTFLTIYPLLFAMFWIAALQQELFDGDRKW